MYVITNIDVMLIIGNIFSLPGHNGLERICSMNKICSEVCGILAESIIKVLLCTKLIYELS